MGKYEERERPIRLSHPRILALRFWLLDLHDSLQRFSTIEEYES